MNYHTFLVTRIFIDHDLGEFHGHKIVISFEIKIFPDIFGWPEDQKVLMTIKYSAETKQMF